MSSVIAVRVSEELKKGLDELQIDYAQEVRRYLEGIVKRKTLSRSLERTAKFRKKLEKKTGLLSSSVDSIRWDREHGH